MGIRESLNRNPRITLGLAVAAIVVAGVTIVTASRKGDSALSAERPASEYYTVDGGKTYFAAPANQVVPFVHEGKKAVRAQVIRCGNEAPRVQYLQRFSPETIKLLEMTAKERVLGWEAEIERLKRDGTQFAEPGSNEWLGIDSPKLRVLLEQTTKCPDGSEPVVVLPN